MKIVIRLWMALNEDKNTSWLSELTDCFIFLKLFLLEERIPNSFCSNAGQKFLNYHPMMPICVRCVRFEISWGAGLTALSHPLQCLRWFGLSERPCCSGPHWSKNRNEKILWDKRRNVFKMSFEKKKKNKTVQLPWFNLSSTQMTEATADLPRLDWIICQPKLCKGQRDDKQ